MPAPPSLAAAVVEVELDDVVGVGDVDGLDPDLHEVRQQVVLGEVHPVRGQLAAHRRLAHVGLANHSHLRMEYCSGA